MKPLLSELFLPCSGMHSPIRANRYPLTTISGSQSASGQTHSRARSHQGDADLRADRSTAYLVSCIRVRSAHGNSLDHLVGGCKQLVGHCEAEHAGALDVDDQLELGRLHDRQVRRLRTLEDATGIGAKLTPRIRDVASVAHQPAGFDIVTVRKYRGDLMERRQVD